MKRQDQFCNKLRLVLFETDFSEFENKDILKPMSYPLDSRNTKKLKNQKLKQLIFL